MRPGDVLVAVRDHQGRVRTLRGRYKMIELEGKKLVVEFEEVPKSNKNKDKKL